MTTQCPQCSMALTFETARLPTDPFTVLCPRCKQSVTIAAPPKEDPVLPEAPRPGQVAAPADGPNELLRALMAALSGQSAPGPAKPEGDKWGRRRVLLCIEDHQVREKARGALEPGKFEVFIADSATEAVELMHDSRAEMLVLSPGFDPDHQGGGSMMQYINRMTPQKRRRTYVILMSPQLRTMDTYLAFANGVNLTVHPEDAGSLQAIFDRSLRDFNELYRPLNQAMEVSPL